MRVALAILCIGAVTFLLRVLAGLVKEWMRMSPSRARIHLAKFDLSRPRGELIEMNPEVRVQRNPARTGERIAL
jgi:hypothetical protein